MDLLLSLTKVLLLNSWQNSAKFILVLSEDVPLTSENIFSCFAMFQQVSIMKAIVILKNRVFGYDFFTRFFEIEDKADLENPFCNGKVQNIEYKVLVGNFFGRIAKRGSEYVGIDVSVMNLIALRDRSIVRQLEIPLHLQWMNEAYSMLRNGSADLSALPGLILPVGPFVRSVNTYDVNAYCALVPLPPRLTFLHFILAPYDSTSWILLVISVIISAFVWQRLTKSFEAAINFILFVVGGFFGQFVVIRVKRKILVLLLQLFVLLSFILGNGYQSLIISSMTASRDGVRFKTFDELFRSHMTILTDASFKSFFNKSGDALQFRLKDYGQNFHLSEVAGKRIAVIATCQQLYHYYYFSSGFDLGSYFYILPDKTMGFYEKLYLALGSPFYDHLQLQHDRIFESGLRRPLLRLTLPPRLAEQNREQAFIDNERYLLFLDDVGGVFFIVLAGHGISTLVLILEIAVKNLEVLKLFFRQKTSRSKQIALALRNQLRIRRIQN